MSLRSRITDIPEEDYILFAVIGMIIILTVIVAYLAYARWKILMFMRISVLDTAGPPSGETLPAHNYVGRQPQFSKVTPPLITSFSPEVIPNRHQEISSADTSPEQKQARLASPGPIPEVSYSFALEESPLRTQGSKLTDGATTRFLNGSGRISFLESRPSNSSLSFLRSVRDIPSRIKRGFSSGNTLFDKFF